MVAPLHVRQNKVMKREQAGTMIDVVVLLNRRAHKLELDLAGALAAKSVENMHARVQVNRHTQIREDICNYTYTVIRIWRETDREKRDRDK